MIKVYVMPNGKLYRFEEAEAPEGAVLYKKPEEKKPEEKAVEPKNKSRKVAKK